MNRLITIIVLCLLVACAPPLDEPAKPTETHAEPVQLAPNPELAFGGCKNVMWIDDGWGHIWEQQCTPSEYDLYGDAPIPIQVDFMGAGFTVHPGGRAGHIGFQTELPIRFEPGAYKLTLTGQLHLWGNPDDFGLNVAIGGNELNGKQLPANGGFLFDWFWCPDTETLSKVAFYLTLEWGSATADSFVQFQTFEIVPVSLDHCK
jgi:hypothetical protein